MLKVQVILSDSVRKSSFARQFMNRNDKICCKSSLPLFNTKKGWWF